MERVVNDDKMIMASEIDAKWDCNLRKMPVLRLGGAMFP